MRKLWLIFIIFCLVNVLTNVRVRGKETQFEDVKMGDKGFYWQEKERKYYEAEVIDKDTRTGFIQITYYWPCGEDLVKEMQRDASIGCAGYWRKEWVKPVLYHSVYNSEEVTKKIDELMLRVYWLEEKK